MQLARPSRRSLARWALFALMLGAVGVSVRDQELEPELVGGGVVYGTPVRPNRALPSTPGSANRQWVSTKWVLVMRDCVTGAKSKGTKRTYGPYQKHWSVWCALNNTSMAVRPEKVIAFLVDYIHRSWDTRKKAKEAKELFETGAADAAAIAAAELAEEATEATLTPGPALASDNSSETFLRSAERVTQLVGDGTPTRPDGTLQRATDLEVILKYKAL